MAPKKKQAKGAGDDNDGPDVHEMNLILEAQVESLKQRLVMEQERGNLAEGKKEVILEEELNKSETIDQSLVDRKVIVNVMTNQYQDMEQSLRKKIAEQETVQKDQGDQITQLRAYSDELE